MTIPSITTAYNSAYGHAKRLAGTVTKGAAALLIAIDAEGDIPEDEWETLHPIPTRGSANELLRAKPIQQIYDYQNISTGKH